MHEQIRAFIAIDLIDRNTKNHINKVQTELQKTLGPLKLVKPEIMHITLLFYGDIFISQAESIYRQIIRPLNEQYFKKPLESYLKGLGKFGKNIYFINIENNLDFLENISKIIGEKSVEMGLKFDRKAFKPHLTIARKNSNRQPPKNFDEIWSQIDKKYADFDFGSFSLEKIHLKKSTLTPQGPIYENLEFD